MATRHYRTLQQAQRRPAALPTTPATIATALEARFGELVAAQRHTGVSLFGVDQNIAAAERLIQALRR